MTPKSTSRPRRSGALPLPLLGRGKVRDIYDAGPGLLLMVASDRVSAFDVILSEPVPRKGEVLTQLTAWWLGELDPPVPNHLVTADPDEIEERLPTLRGRRPEWARRSMLVREARPVEIECVVRGRLAGSAWKEYRRLGTLAGEELPRGLREGSRFDPPLFSPATKAKTGHDENISFDSMVRRVGRERAEALRRRSLSIYRFGARVARGKGLVLADTKFEFGLDRDGTLVLIDELLTPDSSRYWPIPPDPAKPSLDKQPIRDYLDGMKEWKKRPPPPPLPAEVVAGATNRYLEVFERLTGRRLDDFAPPRPSEPKEKP